MKIKTARKSIEEVRSLPGYRHVPPAPQPMFFRRLLKTLSAGELKKVGFRCEKEGMEKLESGEPCLILMNHSSFIDLKIASTLLYPRPFHIVCTADGFVGKEWLMRKIGCIPTFKFIPDPVLVRDMLSTVRDLKESVLLFPEASYSFDGTATPLPETLGKLLKLMKVPVVMIRTYGAFQRDPLYNNLQLRDVPVTAKMTYLLSPEEIREKTPAELNGILKEAFSFDNWKWQLEKGVSVTEEFRADGLHRVLYKCPHCFEEGKMYGKGISLTCGSCGRSWTLKENGQLEEEKPENENDPSEVKFSHIPDWYAWERKCVREEILSGSYRMEIPVTIRVMVDMKAVYEVGEGTLCHSEEGFHLTGCAGEIDFHLPPQLSYSLYADYFWYEIGDMISIGDAKIQYYCFPKDKAVNVAKARLAAEELYKTVSKKQPDRR